ncbi:MAG: Dabb family protein [Bacteroidales bacterium]|nr:Dabb family protein [Bacteroidales bacterium]
MITHIVSILLQKDKKDKATLIVEALNHLPAKIDEIKYYEVGLNIANSPAAYDIVLISKFENLKTLDTYRKHPAHVEVLDLIAKYKESSIVVDF